MDESLSFWVLILKQWKLLKILALIESSRYIITVIVKVHSLIMT